MRIGLTGGIGSGKSTVASLLAERGATVVSADAIARELVQPGSPVLTALAERFGPDIIHASGELDRQTLADRAFASADGTVALDAIMHPLIRDEAERALTQATGIVVYDMPLLAETDQQELVDIVVVVDVPESVQVERASLRGLSRDDVERRMKRQSTRADRLAIADFVLDNSGTLDDLARQVDLLWLNVTEKGGAT